MEGLPHETLRVIQSYPNTDSRVDAEAAELRLLLSDLNVYAGIK